MLSLGIIGLGYWGPNWVRNCSLNPLFNLSWVIDTNPDRTRRIKKQFGLTQNQIYDNLDSAMNFCVPDLVLIATPAKFHCVLGKAVLAKGSRLIVEKPIGINPLETSELIDYARKSGLELFVDHTYIFTGAARKIKEIINSGELGELQFIFTSRLNLGIIQEDVDVIRDLAVHDIALLDFFLEENPIDLSANAVTHYPSTFPSTATLNLNYSKGLIVQINVSWNSPVKVRNIIISGTKKSIIWDDTNQTEKIKVFETSVDRNDILSQQISYTLGNTIVPRLENAEGIYLELNHVSDVILNGVEALNGIEHIKRVNAVITGISKSLQNSGKRIVL